MELSKQASTQGCRLFELLAPFVIQGAACGCLASTSEIEAKARMLPGSSPQRRAQIANFIHDQCTANVRVTTRQELFEALSKLRRRFVYASNGPDMARLHGALMRFTHCNSFFAVCQPTIQVTLATLVASVLVGELMQAVEMVDAVEKVIYKKNRSMTSELADLLELKYGLVNLAQYKLIPGLIEEDCAVKPVCAGALASAAANSSAELEALQLLEMPVRSSALAKLCDFMVRRGTSTSHAVPEYMAGLKIEEVAEKHSPQAASGTAEALNNVMERAQQYERGAVLDGAVSSSLGALGNSPFSGITLQKFVLLEYLHVMKMLANCIAQKSAGEKIRISVNTAPFQTVTASPSPLEEPLTEADQQYRAYQQKLQAQTQHARPPLGNHVQLF
ncbi:virion core protein-like protein [Seal parapoxvirus]|uniref:Assembly protein G7 n=1 Tax=Seal parapoxvirus TaxID=187984 RepID=A0A1Z3GCV4_9POXV|nr:virion core protein-like protein [Seal parapoxvirus]ASC55595.1 virion core protein-like protein [Seal parapoxvirus]